MKKEREKRRDGVEKNGGDAAGAVKSEPFFSKREREREREKRIVVWEAQRRYGE